MSRNETSPIENIGQKDGELMSFDEMLQKIPDSFDKIFLFVKNIAESVTLSKKLLDLIKYQRADINKTITIDSFLDRIEIKNLHYNVQDKQIITDASFTINKGMKCAIIGRNGSGKSSIAKLLLGFDNYQGNILLDDIEITRLNMESYRKLIAYVPQNTSLFNETIYYNLAFGNNKPYSTIIEECKRMGIHDVIMAFPSGYNTCVGEFGNKINGGLRQKIFYTRAFLCDAEIYVFDEPTNNLDEKNSEFLLEYIADPKYANKTFIVICHDMDVVEKFPWIYKFQDGKVFLEKHPSMTGNSLIENV